MFLEEAGVSYALRGVNIGRGGQFAPSFLTIAPNNRIPAIVDNEPAPDWARAAPLLPPKLVPPFFVEAYPGLIHTPFWANLVLADSIDRGRSDEHIREPVFAPWTVTRGALRARAPNKPEATSRGVPNAAKSAGGGAFSIHREDGYDAARLLLPGLRVHLLAVLGPRASAGLPARDILMMWSPDDRKRHDLMAQVAREAASRPFTLSTGIFVVTADGIGVAGAEDMARQKTWPGGSWNRKVQTFAIGSCDVTTVEAG